VRTLHAPVLTGLGSAFPTSRGQSELWDGFFAEHYEHRKKARAIWRRCGVETRHGVADPFETDVRAWGTQQRMEAFRDAALPLGAEAVEAALADAGRTPGDVGLFCVVTCTGYGTPGLDILLARELGMPADVQRVHVGHMGCYAAVPGLATVSDATAARGKVAAMLCVELTSLHIQEPTMDPEQLVAHALFADAAAAAVVEPGAGGFEVVDVAARTDAESLGHMTWDVTDHGFRMGLSTKVPEVLEQHAKDMVGDLLAANDLASGDVAAWAVHPGGPAILEVVERELGLAEGTLDVSREVLRDRGNCSSATVLLVLEKVRAEQHLSAGDHVLMLAFGPGLTLYGALLRMT
jgi:alkylresorcinol/alkylpyrone synthase